ncbi:TAXI family TRAP transporter solute-binding subunit [Nocardiopsis coralliicola]
MERRTVLTALLGAAGAAALAGCAGGVGDGRPAPARLAIATGPPGAVFREIGAALGQQLDRDLPDTEIDVLPTHASAENRRLVAGGEADIGIASLDSIPVHRPGVDALCRLYDSYLHLIALRSSGIRTPGDLEGQRVSIGASDSGTEYTARRLTSLLGISIDAVLLDQADSAAALADGSIDAMFSLTGVPTPAVTTVDERADVRAIDLAAAADAMADAYPDVYYPATLSATAYSGIDASPTFTVPNILIARPDLPDDVAETVTSTVFTSAPRIAETRPEAGQINVRTGIATGAVPLHPGAVRWFRAQKI